MSSAVRRLLIALVAAAVAIAIGVVVLGRGDDEPPEAEVEQPHLRDVDTTTMTVARAAFCDDVPGPAIGAVLDTEDFSGTSYSDGDLAALSPGVRDIAHEFGCSFSADDDSTHAAAWVFAPPVTRAAAKELVIDARETAGCRKVKAPPFGSPTIALTCKDSAQGDAEAAPEQLTSVSLRGLFGDAWLVCEATVPGGDQEQVTERIEDFCLSVAQAAAP